jgi:phosphatidylglycerol:prolipoprotein diacylglycerol transferase
LFTLGWIDIPSFTALMALALGVGLWLTWWWARRMGLPQSDVLDAAFVAVLMGVIGARAAYMAVNQDYFRMHADQIAAIWWGGLEWHGGLFGGVIGVVLVSLWRRLSARRVFDVLTPGLMAGIMLGWIGSFLAGVAYGREVFPGDRWWFLAADLPDVYGLWNPRFATQLLGAAWAVVCLGISIMGCPRSVSNERDSVFIVTLAVYSVGMFVLGFTRGDDVPMIGRWRMDQLIDAGIVVAAAVSILLMRQAPKTERQVG